jgi:hypothetical protein
MSPTDTAIPLAMVGKKEGEIHVQVYENTVNISNLTLNGN